MNKKISHLLLALVLVMSVSNIATAQVTVGSCTPPTYGALLELKSQQAGSVANIGDDANITSTKGGFLLPRVKLTNFTSLNSVVTDGDNLTNEEKLKLGGLLVYNINAIPNVMYLGVYVWNGESWAYLVDSKVSSPMTIGAQPKAFSFYETGEETPDPLEFSVNPPKAADGTIGSVSYQWYQIVGSNLHARVGEKIGQPGTISGLGATTKSFTPKGAIKGTTRNANNAGFYRIYCEAKGSDGSSAISDIAEVAVGCGAKNNLGEWLSFMCFNLGADNDMDIEKQKAHIFPTPYSYEAVSGLHEYAAGEEQVWGGLFQWGRIADGHEERSLVSVRKGIMSDDDIGSGNKCTATDTRRPYLQVKRDATTWYGHFIHGAGNWATNTAQVTLDALWTSSRFVQNDPCAHYNVDGSFQEFWHDGTDGQNDSAACKDSKTAWRTPNQEEWGALYKGGSLSGSNDVATANTWKWYNVEGGSTNLTKTRGFEIKPDGVTTTLFLPIGGYRDSSNGNLYRTGLSGRYWSTTVFNFQAHALHLSGGTVMPAYSNSRGNGYSIRCIKHQ